ncbi:2OG-Fe(II) oxygenase [Rhizorhabdus dicambivorans]|uniref:Proline hydroxylase n=1 Tax=Rhizorhabdus dicambivorans TaxID=1850238 RepID=A0A2A4G0Y8_9SPHN|nr:2OG-Fe(II) oxygenase family protein [Rhizorhabdus dicambivorans]ATE63436.1 proline hydroxylase [Rhizorhabdus dicambivorans]PCE43655.1 proline hydroxylase [Rhizorhabdus dicambivorans]
MGSDFSIARGLDVEALKAAFDRDGRVEVRGFLVPADAARLRAHLAARDDWTLVLNAGKAVYEIPRQGYAQLSAAQLADLDRHVVEAARTGFHYRYETIRVADDPAMRGRTPLDAFVGFMSSPEVLALVAAITGADDIAFADGQATAYSAGHFLTRHDDDVAGKNRRAAYVLGLSDGWQPEWGGLLMFHGADGLVEQGYVPMFGALRLFAVPAMHSVSYVTPLAPEPRLSVTGWLRHR